MILENKEIQTKYILIKTNNKRFIFVYTWSCACTPLSTIYLHCITHLQFHCIYNFIDGYIFHYRKYINVTSISLSIYK